MCRQNGASVVTSDLVLSNSDRRTGGRDLISGSDPGGPDTAEVPNTDAATNSHGNSDSESEPFRPSGLGMSLYSSLSHYIALYYIVLICFIV